MPDPLLVVILVVVVLLIAVLTRPGRTREGRREHLSPPPDLVITPRGFSPWGWWGGSEFVYRTSKLIGPRGRRRVARSVKARGERDRTLEGDEPSDRA